MLMVVGPHALRKSGFIKRTRVCGNWYNFVRLSDLFAVLNVLRQGCYAKDISAPHKFNCIFLLFAMRISTDIVLLSIVIYEDHYARLSSSRWFISRARSARRNKFFFRIPFSKITFPPLSEFNRYFADISHSRINLYSSSSFFLAPTNLQLRLHVSFITYATSRELFFATIIIIGTRKRGRNLSHNVRIHFRRRKF